MFFTFADIFTRRSDHEEVVSCAGVHESILVIINGSLPLFNLVTCFVAGFNCTVIIVVHDSIATVSTMQITITVVVNNFILFFLLPPHGF